MSSIEKIGNNFYRTLGKGEHVDIDLYEHGVEGYVPVRIHFNGHEKEVIFDRSLSRFITILK